MSATGSLPTAGHRPRVLYLVTDAISTTFLRGQLGYLTERGFEVHLACGRVEQLGELAESEGVALHPLPLTRRPSLLDDGKALAASVRLIRRLRPDIVNASTPKAGLLGTLAAWVCRVQVRVYVMRGLRFESAHGLGRRVLRLMEWLTCAAATHVLCNSASLRTLAVEEGVLAPGKGEILHNGSGNGVDASRFAEISPSPDHKRAWGLAPGPLVVGFIGRMTADKGVLDMVRAWEVVRRDLPDVQLLVVGEPDEVEPLDPWVQEMLEGSTDVVMPGWLSDVRPALAAMDVLCFPSYREGLPNAPLEAQVAGVPVVGYAATGTVDAVCDGVTGLLVPLGDVPALADALSRVLTDDAERLRMGATGRAWVSEAFSPRAVWSCLERRYSEWLS